LRVEALYAKGLLHTIMSALSHILFFFNQNQQNLSSYLLAEFRSYTLGRHAMIYRQTHQHFNHDQCRHRRL